MDKIKWLQEITSKNPQDASGWYWLGQELLQQGQAQEALIALSEGLKHCDDTLRAQLIAEIGQASARLQQTQTTSPQTVVLQAGTSMETENAEEEALDATRTFVSDRGVAHDEFPATGTGHRPFQVISGGASATTPVPAEEVITFADVGGLHELKKTIQMKIINPFFNQGLFSRFRKRAGGGVLLYGPPGCGKTYIAKATAGECRAHFLNVHITDILDKYIGSSEQNLKSFFDRAREQKPCVMFFDEIDAMAFNRAKSNSYLRSLVDVFLSEMEGIDSSTDEILFIGATNMPWDVDAAFKRPGRFDRMVFVAPPDLEAREQILALKLQGRPVGAVDLKTLARNTEYFSGADLENVVERAAELVLEDILDTGRERAIEMADLRQAVEQVQPSTLEWLRTVKSYVKFANQDGLYKDVEEYLKKQGRRI